MIPENLKYSKDHEWVRMIDEKHAYVGITNHAQQELGELVYIEVDTIDEELDQDDVFGTVEAVKTTSDLMMPVAGTVLEFNAELSEDDGDNPGLINEDPYDKGWIIKIEVSDTTQLDDLMDAAAYAELIG